MRRSALPNSAQQLRKTELKEIISQRKRGHFKFGPALFGQAFPLPPDDVESECKPDCQYILVLLLSCRVRAFRGQNPRPAGADDEPQYELWVGIPANQSEEVALRQVGPV